MLSLLSRGGYYRISAAALSRIGRIAAASAGLGLVLFAAAHGRAHIEAVLAPLSVGPLHAKEFAVALVSASALPIYAVLLFGLGGVRPAELKAALGRRR
jgi:putative peptidoglycan lipid II flippase